MDVSHQAPVGWVKYWKPKDDWYYLDPAARQTYLDAFNHVIQKALQRGARLMGTYKCRGQSPWARFEVWEFPELQGVIDLTNDLEEIGHFRYFAEDHTVGSRYERTGEANSWVI
jgi:hypothetical protein